MTTIENQQLQKEVWREIHYNPEPFQKEMKLLEGTKQKQFAKNQKEYLYFSFYS